MGKQCKPINPCIDQRSTNAGCAVDATCMFTTPGHRRCDCNAGFAGDGAECAPIDHCAAGSHTCGSHAKCQYTGPDTFTCTCNPGYTGDGTSCQAVNNCKHKHLNTCEPDSECVDESPGKHKCVCKKAGYQLVDPKRTSCEVRDPCTANTHTVTSLRSA